MVPQAVVFLVRPLLKLSEFACQKWPFLIKPQNPLLLRYQDWPFLVKHFLVTFSDKSILSENRLTRCTLSENVIRNGLAIAPHHGSTQHIATNQSISVVRWLPRLLLLLLLFLAGAQLIGSSGMSRQYVKFYSSRFSVCLRRGHHRLIKIVMIALGRESSCYSRIRLERWLARLSPLPLC